jgi:hypothetical protein
VIDPGVVTGSYGVEAEADPPVEEAPELEVPVALDARVRRATGRVSTYVRSNDAALELLGEVEDVVIDAEAIGHPPGVVDVGNRAAARIRSTAPELHGGSDDVMALLAQHSGGNGGVDSTGEGDEDAHEDSFSDRCDT